MHIWPYRILRREDEDIQSDLLKIKNHFNQINFEYDVVIFIKNAGLYLKEMWDLITTQDIPVQFVTVRRVSSSKTSVAKDVVFGSILLSNIMRHVEVFVRLIKLQLKLGQAVDYELDLHFDVVNKRVLVIDDSVDTGTTIGLVNRILYDRGASEVKLACISNHLVPEKVKVDFSVYKHKLLRTKNSRDFNAS